MFGCTDKTKHKIFFACAWVNAMLAVMRFISAGCSSEETRRGHSMSRYKLTAAQEYMLTRKLDEASRNKKIIVAWDWSKVTKTPKDGDHLNKTCGSCIVVYNNNSKIIEAQSAAVVFNYKTVNFWNMPPSYFRRSDQLYVWQSKESPAIIKRRKRPSNFFFEDSKQFNMTMTLRRDSDIVLAYGEATEAHGKATKTLREKYGGSLEKMIDSKSKVAATVVLNCRSYRSAYSRGKIIRRLVESGLKIDRFGSCFSDNLSPQDSEALQPYKFYFALEDSFHCKDYVTKNFFTNGLSRGMVPVVWGARKEDYEAVAPPHSFIHVEDYKSTEELVDYLTHLDENDEAYAEYFRWYDLPEKDMPNFGRATGFCQLCRVVHGINVDDIYKPGYDFANPDRPLFSHGAAPRSVDFMEKVIYGREEADCLK